MTAKPSAELLEFLSAHGYTPSQWEASGLAWEELKAIGRDHASRVRDLEAAGGVVRDKLEQCPAIHTIKMRVKTPESLMEKILRKRLAVPERIIDLETYRQQVSDLVGVRCLHLVKGNLAAIDAFISAECNVVGDVEIWHREGDRVGDLAEKRPGIVARKHERGYRSVHYALQVGLHKEAITVEVQVRTQAEDLWSEIDHKARYGRPEDSPALEIEALDLLNVFMAAADGMVAYIHELRRHSDDVRTREREMKAMADALAALEKANIGKDKELKALRESLDRMTLAQRTESVSGAMVRGASGGLGDLFRDGGPFSVASIAASVVPKIGLAAYPRCATCGNVLFGAESDRCPMCTITGRRGG